MDSILVNGYGQFRNPSNHSDGAISIRETYLIPEAEASVVGKHKKFRKKKSKISEENFKNFRTKFQKIKKISKKKPAPNYRKGHFFYLIADFVSDRHF